MKKMVILLLLFSAALPASEKRVIEKDTHNRNLNHIHTICSIGSKPTPPPAPRLNSTQSPNTDLSPLSLGATEEQRVEQDIQDLNVINFGLDEKR